MAGHARFPSAPFGVVRGSAGLDGREFEDAVGGFLGCGRGLFTRRSIEEELGERGRGEPGGLVESELFDFVDRARGASR